TASSADKSSVVNLPGFLLGRELSGMTTIAATYDYRLVTLSVAIAIFASYAALDLAGRVTANRGPIRSAWLMGGAFAMGSGIWAMHFVGMLAFRLPIPVYYHVPTVALSLLAAILASWIALYVATRERLTALPVATGSLAMGCGIAAMHYTGMAAMRLAAMHQYQRGLWFLSILLAIAISFVGLLLISYFRNEKRGWRSKLVIALVMGLAIPVMHYTGMAAVSFMPMSIEPDLSYSIDISALATFAILITTFLIMGFALVASLVDRWLSAERALLDDERNILRALIDNIPDFVYVKDLKSRFVVANPHVARVVGARTPDELLGKTDFDFFPQEIANAFYEDEQNVIRSGQPLYNREEKALDNDGNEIHILTTKVPLRDNRGQITGIAGIGHDISNRKRMENALREAEQKYRGIFDKAIVGIFQSTPEGRFLSVNPAMAFMLGYNSPDEMIASITDISHQFYVDPKRRGEFQLHMVTLGAVQNFSCEVLRKDGSKISIAMSVRAIRQNGVVVRYEGMAEDITERNLLREQLLQAQKLESVGQLAAGIAHEINTPTQYIGDNVRFLKDAFEDLKSLLTNFERLLAAAQDDTLSCETIQEVAVAVERADAGYLLEEIPKAINQTLEGVTRVSTLVSAMKEFSHPGTKEKIPLDLNHAIESTITVARNEWKYVAELETEFDPSLPSVPCQPGEFNQVILNLIVNAAHAIADVVRQGGPEKGKIKVQTRNCPEWAEIRIQDTGSGIPEKIRSRVFDPFFTTKEIGKGTGQGLAIARSVIVDKHGGSIHFETEEGKGTTFIIRLPLDGKALASKMVVA
ncbi:MAG: MHYT domain-containing protein, partial [Terracidiphilus sp.]